MNEQDANQMYNHVMHNALIYGQGFLRFTPDGKCEVIDPSRYKELAEALLWAEENQVKL
jgi:hypothetical protein